MDYTNKRVNILGTEWIIEFRDEKEDNILFGARGYTDETDNIIVIKKIPKGNEFVNPDYNIKKTIRHEIIHAFLMESGLESNSSESSRWAMNEEMIDWIARQIPKMTKVMKDAEAL